MFGGDESRGVLFLGTCLAIRLKGAPWQEHYEILKPRTGELTRRLELLPLGRAAAHGAWERECGIKATYNRDCLRLLVVISWLNPQKGTVPCQGRKRVLVEPGQTPPEKATLGVGFRSTPQVTSLLTAPIVATATCTGSGGITAARHLGFDSAAILVGHEFMSIGLMPKHIEREFLLLPAPATPSRPRWTTCLPAYFCR